MNRKQFGAFILLTNSLYATANDNIDDVYEKALSAFQNNELNAAHIHIKNILKINSNHIKTRLLLAETLIALGNADAALVELDFAKLNGVDIDRLTVLYAEAYLLQKQFNSVLSITEPGNKSSKLEADLAYFRGQAYFALRQSRSSELSFKRAIGLVPNHQKAYLGLAQNYMSKNEIVKAEESVNKALSFYRPSANGKLLLASIKREQGLLDEALNLINQSLEIEPKQLMGLLTRANLMMSKGSFEEAEKDLDVILEDIPNEPRARYLKTILKASVGDFEKSEQLAAELVTTLSAIPSEVMQTTPDYYLLAGVTHFDLGNFSEAKRNLINYLNFNEADLDTGLLIAKIEIKEGLFLEALRRLGKLNLQFPNNPNILNQMGIGNRAIGNYERATYFYEQIQKLAPSSTLPTVSLARVKMLQGKYDEAIADLAPLVSDELIGLESKLLLVELYQKSSKLEKAEELTSSLLSDYPTDQYLLLMLGRIHGASGDVKQAKSTFQKILAVNELNVPASIHMARINAIESGFQRGIKFLDDLLVKLPDNIDLLLERSNMLLREGNVESATRAFLKVNSLDRTNFDAVSKLVAIYIEQEDLGKAYDILDEFIGFNGQHEDAYKLQAHVFKLQKETKKSLEALKYVVKLSNNKSLAHIELAKAQMEAGLTSDAKLSLKRSLAWDQSYHAASIYLAKIAIGQLDEKEFKDQIEALTQNNAKVEIVELLKVDWLIAKNEYQKAEKLLLKSMGNNLSRRAMLTLKDIYVETGQFDKAITLLSNWLSEYNSDLLAELSFASVLKQKNELEKSKRVYVSIVERHPQSAVAYNNLANVEIALDNFPEAIEAAQKAYELSKSNVNIIDTLAWAHFANEDYRKALSLYREALLIDFSNPLINYNLALTLYELDRKKEAQKHLIEALESDREFKKVNEAKALLDTWVKNG